jgi:dinuclear metal center YbgI/SA1388 family protein
MQIKISEIIQCLNESAPMALQEAYDNSGLLIGDPEKLVDKALLSLDITEAVVEEAISKGCGLIVSHHPLIFKGLKRITPTGPVERIVLKAIQNDIAIASAHTNLDNVIHGVNGRIAEMLGLEKLSILRPLDGMLKKLVTFCPSTHADRLRAAIFEAGAGHIGHYDCCSYNLEGIGTFRAGEEANPFIGEKNEIHHEPEQRIETILPSYLVQKVVQAMIAAHPYEEVAYDIYPLQNKFGKVGAGMLGQLKKPMPMVDFFRFVSETFNNKFLRHSPLIDKPIKRVALCGGSGAFLIPDAKASGADVFITADLKYHDFFEADGKLVLVDAGHFETEQFTKELIGDIIKKKFPNFAPLISEVNTNAVHYFF